MCLLMNDECSFLYAKRLRDALRRLLAPHGQRSSTRLLQYATVYVGPEAAGQLSPTTPFPVVTLPASQVARCSAPQL